MPDWRELDDSDPNELIAGSSEFEEILARRLQQYKKSKFYEDPVATPQPSHTALAELLAELGDATGTAASGDGEGSEEPDKETPPRSRFFIPLPEESAARARDLRSLKGLQIDPEASDFESFQQFVRTWKPITRKQALGAITEKWNRDAFTPELAVLFFMIGGIYLFQISAHSPVNEQCHSAINSNQYAPPVQQSPPSSRPYADPPTYSYSSQSRSTISRPKVAWTTVAPATLDNDEIAAARLRIEAQPRNKALRVQFAQLLFSRNRPNEAIKVWYQIKELFGLDQNEALEMAAAFIRAGRFSEASNIYAQLIQLARNEQNRLAIIDAWYAGYLCAGEQQRAIALIERAASQSTSTSEFSHFQELRQKAIALVAKGGAPVPAPAPAKPCDAGG